MKIRDRLTEKQKKRLNEFRKKNEELSHHDLMELMGVNRDRYKRNRGALRRK